MKRQIAVLGLVVSFTSVSMAAERGIGVFDTFLKPERQADILKKVTEFSKFSGMKQKTLEASKFVPMGEISQYGIQTSKAQYFYKDIPVMGATALVHKRSDGRESFSTTIPSLSLDVSPTFNQKTAISIAQSSGGHQFGGKAELRIIPEARRSTGRLVYYVDFDSNSQFEGSETLVDAKTGEVIAEISKVRHIAPVDVFSAAKQGLVIQKVEKEVNSNFFLGLVNKSEKILEKCVLMDLATEEVFAISAEDCKDVFAGIKVAKACQLINVEDGRPLSVLPQHCLAAVKDSIVQSGVTDEPALRAKDNITKVLNYYMDRFERDSFDNKGGRAISITSVGYQFANASWSIANKTMMYGGGDDEMEDFTKVVDVAGHELTHGVVQHTARFFGMNETGALDEAIADFFGKLIADDGHWTIGKGIFKKNPDEGIRNLENPSIFKTMFITEKGERTLVDAPDHMSKKLEVFGATKKCFKMNDDCYVHGNSTIPSHGLFLIHKAIGQEKVEKILYTALTHYLDGLSQFEDFSKGLKKACNELYTSDTTCESVDQALAAVGL